MMNLAELATKTARRSPGAPALIDPVLGLSRSFGDLDRRTGLLARALDGRLDARGLHQPPRGHAGPGKRVAALARNSLQLFELYLACARSGTLLFPLNWRFSTAQVKEALEDAEPTVVFYEADFRPVIDEIRADARADLKVEAWIEWSPEPGDDGYEALLAETGRSRSAAGLVLPDPATLLDLPYLAISTGGTTGIPKSALHSQRSYGACALNYLAAARIAEDDVYLMLGQMFHVVGYMPLAYLALGRPVAIVTDFDAPACVEIIDAERVSGFFAIATMLPRLISATKAAGRPVPSVRQVEYGGAPMGEEVIRDAADTFGGENIFPGEVERVLGNHAGIAEAVVVGASDPEWGEVVKAVVVRAPGAVLDEAGVARYVEEQLGSYKKPRVVQFVDELPMT